MTLQEFINSKNLTKYQISKLSGIPKSTVLDICSGKSSLSKCTAGTIQQLAKALNCTMEDIMAFDLSNDYDKETGLPINKNYLECALPPYLEESLKAMIDSWEIIDSGEKDYNWDNVWCELNADINAAEIEQEISSEQAW